ncbi:hypothetical protein PIB30_028109 [Stylosanthes scabra]|uniref:Uncharacterized protein n=1 Tax=Stylosanthes scabra TaxID=79078 RepID=A0ABU6TAL4_9FABA|nr:hypothetical protein [Stylosanthes scabra]
MRLTADLASEGDYVLEAVGPSGRLPLRAGLYTQVGLESAVAAKAKAEKEFLAAQDQIAVLKAERDSALTYLPLKEKVNTLADQLSVKVGEYQSALERVSQLEEHMKVLDAELQSCRSSLGREQKRAEVAEKSVETLTSSLGESQIALNTANASLDYWCVEWKKLGTEAMEMCQETLETVLDRVSHLCPSVDFSVIT